MILTLYEASKLSRNTLARGTMTAIATTDELVSQIRMVPKMGESFVYNREKALPSTEFVTPDHSSLASSGATFDQVTVPMRIIASNVDVMNFAEEQQGDTNAQKAVQIEKKLKALGRTIGQKLITGSFATSVALSAAIAGVTVVSAGPNQDTTRHAPGLLFYDQSADELFYQGPGDRTFGAALDVSGNVTAVKVHSDSPSKYLVVTVVNASLPVADAEVAVRIASTTNEWDGLARLCPESQTIASTGTDGDELSLDVMDRMIDEYVKVRDSLVFVFPAKLKSKFYGLVRALGGAGIETTTLPGINGPVPVYRGIPILQSDYIPTNEVKGGASTLSSIYLVSLDPTEGFALAVSGSGMTENSDTDPRVTRVMGVKVRELGQLEDQDASRTRITFYGATFLGSELAVARASELITAIT